MRRIRIGVAAMFGVAMWLVSAAPAHCQAITPGQAMAATVIRAWPAGNITTIKSTGQWGYEEGVLLDGMAAEWHATADGADFAYIKAAVDKYVGADGTVKGYKVEAHSLDNIEMGRAVLLVYRVTQEAKYAQAAKFVHDQLEAQPRTASGGYWHKQIYPNQMWLDGAYMAEPFRAEYAATVHEDADWPDIAKQLLLMDEHMRDPKTGLMKHGWDESKQMAWADKTTGMSPEVWARAMGWYAMALIDVLDWMPVSKAQRPALLAALTRTMAAVVVYQDPALGLWWQVMDRRVAGFENIKGKHGENIEVMPAPPNGNFVEASASCMFVYALAKGVRMGYLPQSDEVVATRGWDGIQRAFVKKAADGSVILTGTVKAAGLGGTPYRSGTFDYYVHEAVRDQDAKGVGAYLMAASEMEQAATEALGQGKTVLMDAWFSSQTRRTALGGTEAFHYKWDDDASTGYSFVGRAFERYGARLAELPAAPTAAGLYGAQVYVIVSPDTVAKNANAHLMDKASGDAVEAWVRAGGVLLLFSNDRDNTEFERFNTLGDRFGIHFNPVLSHHVVEPNHGPGEVAIPTGTQIFSAGWTAYMKDTSTISLSGAAKPVVTDRGDIMIAVSHVGKGVVLGVVDPWFYNEYADGRKMGEYRGFEAAKEIAGWAIRQSR
jgi:unsaturated rhamnogalacturonyl hydrolase